MFGRKKQDIRTLLKAELEIEYNRRYENFKEEIYRQYQKQLRELEETHEMELRGLIKGLGIKCPTCKGSGWQIGGLVKATTLITAFGTGWQKGNCDTCAGRGWLLKEEVKDTG